MAERDVLSPGSSLQGGDPSVDNMTLLQTTAETQTNDAPVGEYLEFFTTSEYVTGVFLYPIICIPGLVANMLTLVVLSRKNMRTSTNAFLSALAVSDSIRLANDLVYFSVILLKQNNEEAALVAFYHFYPYAHFIFNFSVCISSWLIVSVAVERYIMVCHATRAKTWCSRPRAIVTCAVVYVLMISISLPNAFRYKTVKVVDPVTNQTNLTLEVSPLWNNDNQDNHFVEWYTWFLNFIRCNIPLIILIILNFCIINALRKTRANKKMTSRNRVTFMLILVIVVFLVGLTPDAVMSTFFGFGYYDANYLVKGIREYTDTLLAVSAAVNFVIYCACNKNFRQGFAMMFCLCYRKKYTGKIAQMDETQYRRLSEQPQAAKNKSTNTEL